MSMAVVGLIAGMALGFAGYFGGFGAFLLVAALGAVGFVGGPVPGRRPGTGRLLPRSRARRPAAVTRRGHGGRSAGRWRSVPAAERGATTDRRPGGREDRRTGGAGGAGRRPGGRRAAPHATVDGAPRRRPGPGQPRARLPLRHRRPVRRGASPCRPAGKGVGGDGGARGGRAGRAAALRPRARRGTGEDPMSEPQARAARTPAESREASRTGATGRGVRDRDGPRPAGGRRAAAGPAASGPRAASPPALVAAGGARRRGAAAVRHRGGTGRPARHALAPRARRQTRRAAPRRHLGAGGARRRGGPRPRG